ncbi:MAG: 50S ribosomal protein L4 [Caldilineales bacterium]|nr:50S ribosomal protein L4 [Caldilineales bacterium]
MQFPLMNMDGETVGAIELADAVFAAEINPTVMHQALVRQLANRRLGTHKTKGRSDVSGGGRKPWRQKGTGRARQGSIRAPHWRGGGVVFGPTPRTYTQRMPRKMRRLALRSALSSKVEQEQLIVLDALNVEAPRTRVIAAMLKSLGIERSALLLLPAANENVELSARNLPNVKTLHAAYLNVRDLLGYETIILPQQAVAFIESFLNDGAAVFEAEE